jgi:hypothetical protein
VLAKILYLIGVIKIRRYSDKDYLDFIPVKNPNYRWWLKSNGHVVVEIFHAGFFDKIAQKIFGSTKRSEVEMDKYGSFVWQKIDDKRTVIEISELVSKEFGEKAEPLLPRIIKFFQILQRNNYVGFMLKE